MIDHHLLWFPKLPQEKALLQGWDVDHMGLGELTGRQFGLAIGNAWPIPVASRLIFQLNRSMGWSCEAKDPLVKKKE